MNEAADQTAGRVSGRVARPAVRIDGWKAIAAYLRRDRTTVMRWARDRDLPIRRMPGGAGGSVHASADELDAWLARGSDRADDARPTEPSPAPTPRVAAPSRVRRWRPLLLAGAALLALGGATIAILRIETPSDTPAAAVPLRPGDAETTAIYLQARDDWASRTPDGLARAATGFAKVVARDPGFAPAYAGLADVWLLIREYGAVPEPVAYARAEAAARAAVGIDPKCAEAYRALGFVAYWWRRDIAATRAAFARALALAPRDAQTHHWLGNILFDNGEPAAGRRALETARLIEPGAQPILDDYAMAVWASGDGAGGKALLMALVAQHPNARSPHARLADVYFVERDYAAMLREWAIVARLQQNAAMAAAVAADAAVPGGDLSRGALIAAQANDRDKLLAVLRVADARGERWGTATLLDPVFARWRGDAEVTALRDRRRRPPIMPLP